MLLPTLNLVNINISRIMERSSENRCQEGLRGLLPMYWYTSSWFENLILTFLGGAIGIACLLLC
jgi:putative ABC transport system permease protein